MSFFDEMMSESGAASPAAEMKRMYGKKMRAASGAAIPQSELDRMLEREAYNPSVESGAAMPEAEANRLGQKRKMSMLVKALRGE